MYNIAFVTVLLPLTGALVSFLAETSRRVAQVCVFFSFLAVVTALFLLGWRLGHSHDTDLVNVYTFFSFAPTGGPNPALNSASLQRFQPQFGIHVDPISLALMVAVALVGWVVQWHALISVRGDADYRRLFWLSSLLIAAVLGVVVADSLFQMLLLAGTASGLLWLLGTHWWHEDAPATQSRRSFFINRIGDAALLLAAGYIFVRFGATAEAQPPASTLPASDPWAFPLLGTQVNLAVQHGIPGIGMRGLIFLALLMAIAAGTRLAVAPLHLGMLDTEQAPLPALVLGAVLQPVIGVVLVTRFLPIFMGAQYVLGVFGVLGALTALGAALMALVQRDMARVVLTIAIAQLGVIVAALGTGGFSAPLQMTVTYAAATTLLFLVAGNFVRSYRTRDIMEMGGGWKRMRGNSLLLGAWVVAVAGVDLVSYQGLSTIVRNQSPQGTGAAAGKPLVVISAVLVTLAVAITTAAAVRLWMVVSRGDVAKRRGFNPGKMTASAGALTRSATAALLGLLAAVALGIPTVPVTFSHFVFFGPAHQNLGVQALAIVLAVAAGLVGVASGWVLGRRAEGDAEPVVRRVLRQSGSGQDAIPRAAGWVAHRTGAMALATDTRLLDVLFGAVGEGLGVTELLVNRLRSRRLTAYLTGALIATALLTLCAGLFATGHFPRLAP